MTTATASFAELFTFFHDAIWVSLLTGAILGPAGLFLHLRRSLFLGAALPQLAGFSFVLAGSLGIPLWISALALLSAFALFAGLKPLNEKSGLTLEAMIGIGYAVAMSGTVLLLALTHAESHASELLLKGSVLAATCRDTRLLAGLGLPLLAGLFVFRRRLYLVSLAPETALTMGLRVAAYEIMLFLALGLAITLTLTEAGALACFGFLLFPSLCAQALCRQMRWMFLICALVGIMGAGGGLCLSLVYDLPAGPAMVAVLLLLWILSMGWARWSAGAGKVCDEPRPSA
jgi:ABC-type Mn2+/Zn2+ transport system permease subunit